MRALGTRTTRRRRTRIREPNRTSFREITKYTLNILMMRSQRMRTELREYRKSMSYVRASTGDQVHKGPELLLIEVGINSGFVRGALNSLI